MTAPKLYLLLPGTAREALVFYQTVFGGSVTVNTYAEFERVDGPGDDVAHGVLSGPVSLYLADAGAAEDAVNLSGAMLALLGTADPATLHGWFDALAEGGEVLDQLAVKPWGASDGQVRDRFGLRWLIGYEPASPNDLEAS